VKSELLLNSGGAQKNALGVREAAEVLVFESGEHMRFVLSCGCASMISRAWRDSGTIWVL
jgi:hypothetical protein